MQRPGQCSLPHCLHQHPQPRRRYGDGGGRRRGEQGAPPHGRPARGSRPDDASSGAAAPADAPEHPLSAAFRVLFAQDNEDEDGHTLGKVRLGVWRVRRRSSSRGRGADDA